MNKYQPTSAEDMQDALRDIFDPMFEAMLQGEMNSHLGYDTNDHGYKETSNRRNGYIHKSLKTSMGEVSKLPKVFSFLSGRRLIRRSVEMI